MKHQYLGDINDYRKYGLLRMLAEGGKAKIGICWMLTPNDGSGHGGRVAYLEKPEKWKSYDPELFESLREIVKERNLRNVACAERAGILPPTSFAFFKGLVPEHQEKRKKYFERILCRFRRQHVGLVFFDPDTGLAPPSAPFVRKMSSHHLYWKVLSIAFGQCLSVLVIQFFPFVPREKFIAAQSRKIREATKACEVFSVRTANAVFFLVLQERGATHFRSLEDRVRGRWVAQMELCRWA
jgi:hypothetical protein